MAITRIPRAYEVEPGTWRVPVRPCDVYGSASDADCRRCPRYDPVVVLGEETDQCRYLGYGYRWAERSRPE